MVRRSCLALVALALVVPVPASAAPGRTVEAPYYGPGGMYGHSHGEIVVLGQYTFGAGVVPTRARDKTIELAVADATGLPVFFEAAQYADDRFTQHFVLGRGCGRTDRPLRVPFPERPVFVVVAVGACGSGTSVPTTGTVTATLR